MRPFDIITAPACSNGECSACVPLRKPMSRRTGEMSIKSAPNCCIWKHRDCSRIRSTPAGWGQRCRLQTARAGCNFRQTLLTRRGADAQIYCTHNLRQSLLRDASFAPSRPLRSVLPTLSAPVATAVASLMECGTRSPGHLPLWPGGVAV